MTLVQVAYLGLQAESSQESPTANAEDLLLLQSQVPTASVEFTGNPAMRWDIRRIVRVQQIQLRPANLHLPGANPELGPREIDCEAQPFPVCLTQRFDRQLAGIVERIESLLLSLRVDFLSKITLLIEQAHTDDGDSEIAGCLELIAGNVSKPARINRQR